MIIINNLFENTFLLFVVQYLIIIYYLCAYTYVLTAMFCKAPGRNLD